MVRIERAISRARSFQFRKMFDLHGRQAHSLVISDGRNGEDEAANIDEIVQFRSYGGTGNAASSDLDVQSLTSVVNRFKDKTGNARVRQHNEMEMMKEKFSKLLLGEDMSGGGKGVSSAMALSNAITNLAASVFGEQRKLEPMAPETKARWRREMGWLLSVSDHIVELIPSQQMSKDGTSMEIMVTEQRRDLHMNIPALRKLDTMLIDCLDKFRDKMEFWYVSRHEEEAQGEKDNDKWWLPTVKVPPNGLSDISRKWLQILKDSVNQVLKASMAINSQILTEMEIPESYIEALPKNGRASLGDAVYKSITVDTFDPHQFLSTMDLSTEHKVLDLKNRVEASIVIWRRKINQKDARSSWGSSVSVEKRELFEERAETILFLLKHRFPGLPQSTLDISKIQFNRDVGFAILESYSRVLESLANTVMSRIEDVLSADSRAQAQSLEESKIKASVDSSPAVVSDTEKPDPAEMSEPTATPDPTETSDPAETPDPTEMLDPTKTPDPAETPDPTEMLDPTKTPDPAKTTTLGTISDCMGGNVDQSETDMKKFQPAGNFDSLQEEKNEKPTSKPTTPKKFSEEEDEKPTTPKKFSYLERLEVLGGLRSPIARH